MAAIDEITIPGGIKVFFTETGGVEKDLGNIVGDSVSINRDSNDLDHYSNRSGLRRKNKTFAIEENLQIDFELDEVNVGNMRLFFKGGSLTSVGAGTAGITDQKETLTAETFVSVEKPGLTSVTARQFLDYVYLFDGVSTYTDHSTEADTAAGTPFTINADAGDYLYLGKLTQFKELDIDVATAMTGYTNALWEYWDGSTWSTLSMTGTDDFSVDATLSFTVPGDWALTTVNSVQAYWIRFSQDAASPAVPATLNSIGRQTLTENTDYKVNAGAAGSASAVENGSIARVAAGALVSGEEIKVSFTYVTFTGMSFGIAEQSTIEGSARFECYPQSGRGSSWNLVFPRCQIKNNGSMDLDDSNFQKLPLSLVVLDDSEVTAVNPFGTATVFPIA